jgi:hypothetical protein
MCKGVSELCRIRALSELAWKSSSGQRDDMGTGYERNHNSNDLMIFFWGRTLFILSLRRGDWVFLVFLLRFWGGLGIFIFIKLGRVNGMGVQNREFYFS